MKLFVIRAKAPQTRVQRIARQLLNCANVTGVCLSKHYRVMDDPEDSNDVPVFTFICSAKGALDPQEIITLMTIFVVEKTTILGISYTDAVTEEDLRQTKTSRMRTALPVPVLRLAVDNTKEEP